MWNIKKEKLSFLEVITELKYIRDYFKSKDEKQRGKENKNFIQEPNKLVYAQQINAPSCFNDNEYAFTIGSSDINPFHKINTTKSFQLAMDDIDAKWVLIINKKHENYEKLKKEFT